MEPCKKSEPRTLVYGKRVLVVDDDWLVGHLACEILKHFGFQADFESDPVEALALFQRNPQCFDLIITDMDMPKMTGDQLAMEIMNLRNNIPIIMCTGGGVCFTEEEFAQMGIQTAVEKPFLAEELIQTVHRFL